MSKQITLYTNKVKIALSEAKATYTSYELDATNFPDWYKAKVNPARLTTPHPESTKIPESLSPRRVHQPTCFPDSGILPKDPIERARVRLFIDAVSTKFLPAADIALAPFLLRLEVLLEHDIGAYRVGEGRTAYDIIFSTNGHFARLVQYLDALKARESVRSTFDVEVIKEGARKRSAPLRV
ncbi:glutathione S-transferase [Mycena rebaudengoi]|nr:glutathione S-transferase [Mycena rebaudengoi]